MRISVVMRQIICRDAMHSQRTVSGGATVPQNASLPDRKSSPPAQHHAGVQHGQARLDARIHQPLARSKARRSAPPSSPCPAAAPRESTAARSRTPAAEHPCSTGNMRRPPASCPCAHRVLRCARASTDSCRPDPCPARTDRRTAAPRRSSRPATPRAIPTARPPFLAAIERMPIPPFSRRMRGPLMVRAKSADPPPVTVNRYCGRRSNPAPHRRQRLQLPSRRKQRRPSAPVREPKAAALAKNPVRQLRAQRPLHRSAPQRGQRSRHDLALHVERSQHRSRSCKRAPQRPVLIPQIHARSATAIPAVPAAAPRAHPTRAVSARPTGSENRNSSRSRPMFP